MGLAIIFVVSTIIFVLTFRLIGSIIQFVWIVAMHGNEYAILAVIFVGTGSWLIYAL